MYQISCEDPIIHTSASPVCSDASCPCQPVDEHAKLDYMCIECGRHYSWSAEDISWEYEKPFMPCGHSWHTLSTGGHDE